MAIKNSKTKKAFDLVSFAAFRAFRRAVKLLPERATGALVDLLTLAWWAADTRRRRMAQANLAIAYPAWTPGKRRLFALSNCRHLCRVLLETFKYDDIDASNWESRVKLCETWLFEEAHKRGKGTIGISAHLGNWEMLACHSYRYGRVFIVARAIHNPYLDREIRERREKADVTQIYPDRESPRKILKALREGYVVCFLVDQSAKGNEGVSVPFFGKPAPTHSGPALIALRSGAAVVPVWTEICSDGITRMHYGRELELIRTGDLKADVEANTALFTARVEEMVRACPEQWFWVHDRWRLGGRKRKKRR